VTPSHFEACQPVEVVPVPDEAAKERAHIALCRFVFPHYVVPRWEMAAAALAAAHDYGDDWMDRLPPKRIAQGPPWPDEAALERGAKALEAAVKRGEGFWDDLALAVLRAALDPDARPETPAERHHRELHDGTLNEMPPETRHA
jgi:hypothetical protein